jgi:fructokinase
VARLGNPVTLRTRLGRDAFGTMVRDHLENSRVVVDAGPSEEAFATGLAMAMLFAGVATYDFKIEWDVTSLVPLPVETRCMDTGSLATVLEPGRTNVVDLMEREHERGWVTVSYHPNVRAPR